MQVAEYNHEEFKSREAADDTLLVKFFVKAVKDEAKSLEEGRPVFKDVEYIDIRVPGQRDSMACRPASARDIERFPRHYHAFKERTELPQEGTPLSEWPAISRSQAEELSFYNVKTVEQLAELSDTHASQFMGIQALKRQAKDWLEVAKEQAAANNLRKELEQRDEMIASLQEQINELTALLEPEEDGEIQDD